MSIYINSYGIDISKASKPVPVTVECVKGTQVIVFTCLSDKIDTMIASIKK